MKRIGVVILFVTCLAALLGMDDPRRAQIQAAHADAIASLVDEVKTVRLTPNLTVAQFLDRTAGEDRLRQVVERRVEQIGATRWPDSGTCQVQLEVPGREIASTLVEIARNESGKSPLPAEALAKRLESTWQDRTFAATGTSASPEAVARLRPGPEQPLWLTIPEADRQAAVKAAQTNAARRAVDNLSDVRLGDGKTVADALEIPSVRQAIQQWVATRPVTDIEFRNDGEVSLSVSAPGEELWTVFREAVSRQKDVPAPRDEGEWQRLHDEVVARLRSPVGGRSSVADRRFTSRPTSRTPLPAQPPGWVDDQIDVDGAAAGEGDRLRLARTAEAEALRDMRTRVESLPLADGVRLGEAASRDPAVAAAIERSLLRARTRSVDWGPGGHDVEVHMYLDLRHVWQELPRR